MFGFKKKTVSPVNQNAEYSLDGLDLEKEVMNATDAVAVAETKEKPEKRSWFHKKSESDMKEAKEVEDPIPPTVPVRRRRSINQPVTEETDTGEDTKAAIIFNYNAEEVDQSVNEESFFTRTSGTKVTDTDLLTESDVQFIEDETGKIVKVDDRGKMQFRGQNDRGVIVPVTGHEVVDSEETGVSRREISSEIFEDVPIAEDEDDLIEDGSEDDLAGNEGESESIAESKATARSGERVFDFLQRTVNDYVTSLKPIGDDDASVLFDSDVEQNLQALQDGSGRFYLPNVNVYKCGIREEWNSVHEIRVSKGAIVELDFGMSILVPNGFAVELRETPECREKYGLSVVGSALMLTPEAAARGVSVRLQGCSDMAYLAEYRPIFTARIIESDAV